ncbi:MAG: class I SAM-dependent methyltransferase [Eubacteriales bacterium]|nr:class I SAM-dependent methyltransferase [Eubacteriales bacterium]
MNLSERLRKIFDMVTPGSRIADVGCDHGYLSIALIEEKIAVHAIAMDVAKGPLSTAQENIRLHGLDERIETRLSDGLAKLKQGEADCVILAGMGGILMRRILQAGLPVLEGIQELILEPQSEYEEVRRFLADHGFVIDREDMVTEERKFYPIIHARPGEPAAADPAAYTLSIPFEKDMAVQLVLAYGPCILEMRHPVLLRYLDRRSEIIHGIEAQLKSKDTAHAKERLLEIEAEKLRIREARRYFV